MSSQSNHSDIAGESATETTESSDAGPVRTDDLVRGRSRHGDVGGTHHVSSRRVRIHKLQAEIALLETERETLTDEVATLESEVEAFENEVASLERTIEGEKQRRQQVITRYEHVIAEKEQAYEELRQDIDGTPTDRSHRPLAEAASQMKTMARRVRRFLRSWGR